MQRKGERAPSHKLSEYGDLGFPEKRKPEKAVSKRLTFEESPIAEGLEAQGIRIRFGLTQGELFHAIEKVQKSHARYVGNHIVNHQEVLAILRKKLEDEEPYRHIDKWFGGATRR